MNFEEPQVRDSKTIYTSDELDVAVEQAVLDRAKASEITATCAYVESLVAAQEPPFRDSWDRFRPPPEWPAPAVRPG